MPSLRALELTLPWASRASSQLTIDEAAGTCCSRDPSRPTMTSIARPRAWLLQHVLWKFGRGHRVGLLTVARRVVGRVPALAAEVHRSRRPTEPADDLVERPPRSGEQTPGAHLAGGSLEHQLVVAEVVDRVARHRRGEDRHPVVGRRRRRRRLERPGVGRDGPRCGDVAVLVGAAAEVAVGASDRRDEQHERQGDEQGEGGSPHGHLCPTVHSCTSPSHSRRAELGSQTHSPDAPGPRPTADGLRSGASTTPNSPENPLMQKPRRRRLAVTARRARCRHGGDPRQPAQRRRRVFYNGAGSAPRISIIGDSTIAALRWTNQFEPLKRFNFTYDAESCRRTVLPSCRGREGYTPDTTLNAMRRLSGQLGSVLFIMGGYDDSELQLRCRRRRGDGGGGQAGHPDRVWLTLRIQRLLRRPRGDLVQRHVPRHQPDPDAEGDPVRPTTADRRLGVVLGEPSGVVLRRRHPLPPGRRQRRRRATSPTRPTVCSPARSSRPPAGQARPSAPRALSASVGYGVGSGRVRLTWTGASSRRVAVPITDYVIQRSWNGGRTWVSLSDGVSTNRSYTVGGHTNGATYLFRVAARNAVGWSPPSNVVGGDPAGRRSRRSPRSLTASPGSGHVDLNWIAPSSSGGLPITGLRGPTFVQLGQNLGVAERRRLAPTASIGRPG